MKILTLMIGTAVFATQPAFAHDPASDIIGVPFKTHLPQQRSPREIMQEVENLATDRDSLGICPGAIGSKVGEMSRLELLQTSNVLNKYGTIEQKIHFLLYTRYSQSVFSVPVPEPIVNTKASLLRVAKAQTQIQERLNRLSEQN